MGSPGVGFGLGVLATVCIVSGITAGLVHDRDLVEKNSAGAHVIFYFPDTIHSLPNPCSAIVLAFGSC